MAATYRRPRPRGLISRGMTLVEDFMNWFLFGTETWLVAVIKGVPLFLFAYFVLAYIPNYAYYLSTQFLFKFSDDVGYLVATVVGATNFLLIIILVVVTQAARGRQGFWWSLIRYFNFLNYLFIVLLLIPLMAFNLAGGTFFPEQGREPFPLQALALGTIAAGGGGAALVYLYLEYRRITRREARRAAAASASYSTGGA